MNYRKIVFFDLEMCCWDEGPRKTGEIIEIGLAEVDLVKMAITKQAQYYVKPEKDEISAFCTGLTGITPKTIAKQGRALADVIQTMLKNFGGANKVYAAWGRDDLVLFNECDAKGIARPFKEFLNIAALHRLQIREGGNKANQIAAMRSYGLEFEGVQHSGYVDAYNLARLGIEMFK